MAVGTVLKSLALLLLASACATAEPIGGADAASTDAHWQPPAADEQRFLAVISDLHAGLGRRADGSWHETEDFRWEAELDAFLDAVAVRGGEKVDLVVAGDLLELWQLPADISCRGVSADLGCTVDEMREVTTRVLAAHAGLPASLRRFAARGSNRVHVIPGNHDSALLLARVWQPLADAVGVEQGRINLVASGVWTSRDGAVVIEHGHQIGNDVNRYDAWPNVSRQVDGRTFIERPWGERFVQKLFNEQETAYPIIDNLSPEAAGARYRMADRGLWGSVADVARFLVFNLTETSIAQKNKFVGVDPGAPAASRADRGRALGHRLFAQALSDADPFRRELLADTPQGAALRHELDGLLRDGKLSEPEVLLLCDVAAVVRGRAVCVQATTGYLAQKLLVPHERVLREHLKRRLDEHPRMQTFIYGHTHELERRWNVAVSSMASVAVLNSGAFQRVIDESGYLARVKGPDPADGLRQLSLSDLPPCYSAVLMPNTADRNSAKTWRWYMPDNAMGEFVEVGDARCN